MLTAFVFAIVWLVKCVARCPLLAHTTEATHADNMAPTAALNVRKYRFCSHGNEKNGTNLVWKTLPPPKMKNCINFSGKVDANMCIASNPWIMECFVVCMFSFSHSIISSTVRAMGHCENARKIHEENTCYNKPMFGNATWRLIRFDVTWCSQKNMEVKMKTYQKQPRHKTSKPRQINKKQFSTCRLCGWSKALIGFFHVGSAIFFHDPPSRHIKGISSWKL